MYGLLSGPTRRKKMKMKRRRRKAIATGSTGLPGNVPGTFKPQLARELQRKMARRRSAGKGTGRGELQILVLDAYRAFQAGDDGPFRALRAEHGDALRRLPGRVASIVRRMWDGETPTSGGVRADELKRRLRRAKDPRRRRVLRKKIRRANGGGTPEDPDGGAPVVVDDGDSDGSIISTGDPELDAILARMDGLEDLLKIKGKGKKKIKIKIGKLKNIFGDVMKAKGKRAAAGTGDLQTGGQYAEQGAQIIKQHAGEDIDGALRFQDTDKSRYVESGANAAFGHGSVGFPGDFGYEDLPVDFPMDYPIGGEFDPSLFPGTFPPGGDFGYGFASDFDDGSFVMPGSATFDDLDPFDGWGDSYEDTPEFYDPSIFLPPIVANKPLPWGGGAQMPGDAVPMDFGPGLYSSVPGTGFSFEEVDFGGGEQSLFPLPSGMIPPGSPPYQEGDEYLDLSFDDLFPVDYTDDSAFLDWNDWDEPNQAYSGVVDMPYDMVYDYGSGPGIDQNWLLTDEEAGSALSMLDDQLSDGDALMVNRLLPAFKTMRANVRTNEDRKRVAVLDGLLREYTHHRKALRDGIDGATSDGLSGIPFLGAIRALGGIHGIGITVALVVFSSFVGGGVKDATKSVGTGLKWGIGIIGPMLGVIIGARILAGKKLIPGLT